MRRVDPSKLTDVTLTSTYETGTTGYGRTVSSAKPAGVATTSTVNYYGPNQGYGAALNLGTPVCGLPLSTPQYGAAQTTIAPAGADGLPRTTTHIYDLFGRVVAEEETGDATWTCTSYDLRGRVSSVASAATGTISGGVLTITAPARTVTTNYAVNTDPLTGSVSDTTPIPGSPHGDVITQVSDLLGREVSYTDVWGTTTSSSYTPAGQVTSRYTIPMSGGAVMDTFTYDAAGQVTAETNDGVAANLTYGYNSDPELLASVSYPAAAWLAGNGTTATLSYDASLRETGLVWSFTGSVTATDTELLSEAGKVLQDTLAQGTGAALVSTYSYDAADRLTQAVIPGHTLTYGFGTASCGADTLAGRDGNRTSYTDVQTTGTSAGTHQVGYCYDNADRLTGTTVTNPVVGVSAVFSQALTTTGTSPSIGYDPHGNTTTLADESISYDSTDRHTGTTLTDGTSVVYVRDVADRIVAETTTLSGRRPRSGTATPTLAALRR